jgi:hypothetical protein
MPTDPMIRQLAADPDAIFTIRAIDCFFEFIAKEKDLDPVFDAEITTEQMVEEFWKMMKRGFLRLMDDGDDDDAPLVTQTVTPAERAHARVVGAKLFAVRQRLRRAARRGSDETSPPRRRHSPRNQEPYRHRRRTRGGRGEHPRGTKL